MGVKWFTVDHNKSMSPCYMTVELTFELLTLWLIFLVLFMANEMVTIWEVARSID